MNSNISDEEKVNNALVADLPTSSSTGAVSAAPIPSGTSSPTPTVLSPIPLNSITTSERKDESKSAPVLDDIVQEDDVSSENSKLKKSRKRNVEDQPSTSAVSTSEGIALSRPKRTQRSIDRPGIVSWDDFCNFNIPSSGDFFSRVRSLSSRGRLLPSNSMSSSSSSSSPSSSNMDDDEIRSVQADNRTQTTSGISDSTSDSTSRSTACRIIEGQPSTSAVPPSDGIASSRPKRTQKSIDRPGTVSWDDFHNSNIPSSSSGMLFDIRPSASRRSLLSSNSLPSSSSSSSPSSSNMDDDEMNTRPVQADNGTQSTSGISGSTSNRTSRSTTLRSWNHKQFIPTVHLPSPSVPSTSSSSNSALNCPSTSEMEVIIDGTSSYMLNSESLRNSLYKGPIMVLECRNAEDKPDNINEMRIKVVRKFEWELPRVCDAARSGLERGTFTKGCEFPGIPKKKFSEKDYLEFGHEEQLWSVQALFTRVDDPDRLTVLYEGWATVFDQAIEDVRKGASEAYQIYLIRDRFLSEVATSGPEWTRELAEEQRVLKRGKQLLFLNHDSSFWVCQDLSYYHTILHKERHLAPIFYIGLASLKSPPKFLYTAVNVLKGKTYERLLQLEENKSFAESMKKNGSKKLKNTHNSNKGACENKEQCVCDKKFQLLYSHAEQYLQQDADGKLDVSNFDTNKSAIVVECSDECGCSSSCPRRALQKGQQTPLVVFFEGEAGWGLRAGGNIEKGSLVCEYTGEGYYKPSEADDVKPKRMGEKEEDVADPEKDTSYECDFKVMNPNFILCAGKIGNVARFLNHNCDPNCAFVETHSRELASDLLIPRICVYALRDIKVGETVNISYWGDVSKLVFEPSQNKCRCGSTKKKCIEFLPAKLLNKNADN
ncbi:hypothetical protein CAEBREN_15025 [Caenorhabditis brenneri]|uniref:SET domain-containing protein n=1 Tax=Caenorhabditis brenneri TaxID=135651 RepID=G0MH63_CAEBE|nr:hypothetical protein CAEBREN_15025 [Caenorhabditis brenneri]